MGREELAVQFYGAKAIGNAGEEDAVFVYVAGSNMKETKIGVQNVEEENSV